MNQLDRKIGQLLLMQVIILLFVLGCTKDDVVLSTDMDESVNRDTISNLYEKRAWENFC